MESRLLAITHPDVATFLGQREAVRAQFVELLGGEWGDGGRPPLESVVRQAQDCGRYTRRHVTYCSEPGEQVTAWLLVPKDVSGEAPAVICPHGHGGRFDLGKDGVIGVDDPDVRQYGMDFGRALAERGYVVLAPDARGFGERIVPAFGASMSGERYIALSEILCGSSLAGRMTYDLMRGVDFLLTRPEVDSARIGCAGFSMGVGQAVFLAAVDPRIAAVACVCGLSDYAAFNEHKLEHCFFYYVPALLRRLEMSHISALIAPRPLLVINGRHDTSLPLDGMLRTTKYVEQVYAQLDAADRFFVHVDDCDHCVTAGSGQRMGDWMDQWL